MNKIPFNITTARILAGAGSFGLVVMVFVMMYLKPEIAKDDLFKSLAQAVVIQGLIGLVMAFLFTGDHARKPRPPEKPPEHTIEEVHTTPDT